MLTLITDIGWSHLENIALIAAFAAVAVVYFWPRRSKKD